MCSVKIFDYKINADLNKNVFNLDLKIATLLKIMSMRAHFELIFISNFLI